MAVRIECKTPFVTAEITQATKMAGSIAQALDIFFASFIPICGRPAFGENRLGVRVNVTELIPETNLKARVFALEFFLRNRWIRFSTSAWTAGGIFMPPELGSNTHCFGVILCLPSFEN